jgi:hypothetical protein
MSEKDTAAYANFVEGRIAAGDTPYMMKDSTWAALPHVATAEQLDSYGESIPKRDCREPEFEEFVQRRLAAGDRARLIVDGVTQSAYAALAKAKHDGKTLTKEQRAAAGK